MTSKFFDITTKLSSLGAPKAYNVVNGSEGYDDEEDKSKLLICPHCHNDRPDSLTKEARRWDGRPRPHLAYYGGWALSAILFLMLTGTVWLNNKNLKQKCFRATSSYSPLLGQVPDGMSEITRNGSIRWPSIYRGPPNPEVDRAWEEISVFRPLSIQLTEEEYLRVGMSPETAARNAPEFGGGFFLQTEFSHQLHCVNLMRKGSHFKYGYYKKKNDPDFHDSDEVFQVHFDHCVEMLRQFVMCHADVGLVTAHWLESRNRPWPDFNTRQTCRDFDGIWRWTVEHQLPEGAPNVPLKPEGAKGLVKAP